MSDEELRREAVTVEQEARACIATLREVFAQKNAELAEALEALRELESACDYTGVGRYSHEARIRARAVLARSETSR